MGRLTVEDLSLEVPARRLLAGASFGVAAGECVAVVGPSGVGKTSLLNCVAGIDTPAAGSVRSQVPGRGVGGSAHVRR
ncbi:MAG: ATP-binding cassette domain-containing protein [Gaiellaceae bacterium]